MTGFFAILKNISMLADDTVMAAKHTASILSDDIAVSAEQSSTFSAKRELPSVWAIMKGSFVNKLIVVPIILLLYVFIPSLIEPLLILGALYLSYEGYEKILEILQEYKHKESETQKKRLSDAELLAEEKKNVKAAIIMDFVLSIEIVVITLSFVTEQHLNLQSTAMIVSIVSLLATIIVYGTVALIIRLDDIGLWFYKKGSIGIGNFLIKTMGILISALGYIGLLAMLLVGGDILSHHLLHLHLETETLAQTGMSLAAEMVFSLVFGAIVFYCIHFFLLIKQKLQKI